MYPVFFFVFFLVLLTQLTLTLISVFDTNCILSLGSLTPRDIVKCIPVGNEPVSFIRDKHVLSFTEMLISWFVGG